MMDVKERIIKPKDFSFLNIIYLLIKKAICYCITMFNMVRCVILKLND